MRIMRFLWSQQVGPSELFDLILRMVFTAEEDDEDTGDPRDGDDSTPIVKALIEAYLKLCEVKGEDVPLTDSFSESESVYQKAFFRAWPEAKGADGIGWYPEALPCEGNLPIKMLKYLGNGMGHHERQLQEAWVAYYREHEAEIKARYSGEEST